ncbi:unnamed protein product [Vitrella brassicaformis CCMP3155]|uniref:Phosphatidic acid phosphatase type 2/haloperoxidase domain-containing protein n=1 Tax=Vitrella brassicaformis (strain CCMP3155) TaxID=1169540 RepID=A0A0G4G882_VITBC|nr:unnamed protein product [Vitrella brassicaformis CCMP3155]|mmetsp:Transcript_53211/g.133961  ORF Transcript_53211/g.133961 Transcript_53211/m.133961 type:complete len:637 (-) Transcript_53211:1177-3087(-)|eukprot:CEM24731.1 unnamed protein product [Vitrella brassicaformis CCMP3155]
MKMAILRPVAAVLLLLLVAAPSPLHGAEDPDGKASPKRLVDDIGDLLYSPLNATKQAAESLLETASNLLIDPALAVGEGFLTRPENELMDLFHPFEAVESLQGKLQALTRLGLAELTDRVPRAFWDDVFNMPSLVLANMFDYELIPYVKDIPTIMCLWLAAPHILKYEPPVQNSHILMQNVAIFHAVAAYTDDWDVFFGPDRRAPKYMRTHRNRQEAGVHACYEIHRILTPQAAENFAQAMVLMGYNPLDKEPNEKTPAGLGHLMAKEVVEWFKDDGFNKDGTMMHEYNGLAYEDWTEYKPVNGPHKLTYPTYWQPLIEAQGVGGSGERYGYNVLQTHITPHAGKVRPFFCSQEQVDAKKSPAIYNCTKEMEPEDREEGHQGRAEDGDGRSCIEVLKERSLKVIEESLKLDEKKKAFGEYFDNKLYSLGPVPLQLIKPLDMNFEEFTALELGYAGLLYDATIVAWKEKVYHDGVRPQSFIQEYFADEKFKAYVPKVGIREIMGKDWKSYFRTMPHTEYPSGSACFCRASMEYAKIAFKGFDIAGKLRAYFPKGSSVVETGTTPTKDLIIEWESFDQIADTCSKSRVWTGVHFEQAIDPKLGAGLCDGIGELVFKRVQKHSGGILALKEVRDNGKWD